MNPVLVIGATGYVGARLVLRLRKKGYPVRAAGRSADKLRLRPFATDPGVELVETDVLDPGSLRRACAGISEPTLKRALSEMAKEGRIKRLGVGPAAQWVHHRS